MKLSFNRLKWFSIVGPIIGIALFHFVADIVFHDYVRSWMGYASATLIAAITIVAFGQFIFREITRLERRILRQNAQLALTTRVSASLSEARPIDGSFQQILDDVLDSLSIESGLICLLEEERDELYASAHRGLQPGMVEMVRRAKVSDRAIGAAVIRSGKPVVIDDATEDPRTAELAAEYGFQSLASVPLLLDGRARGIIAFMSPRTSVFTADYLPVFLQIGREIALAAERSQLLEDVLGRSTQLDQLNRVSAALSKTLNVDEVMGIALESAMEVSGAGQGEVWLFDRADSQPALRRTRGGAGKNGKEEFADDHCAALRQRVGQSGRPQFDLSNGSSIGCLPLSSGGETAGAICIHGLGDYCEHDEVRRLLESIAEQSSVALSNAELHLRVKEVAVIEERERIAREMHDGLGQVLGYVNTKAFAIRRMLSMGKLDSAQEMLNQLEEAAREVSNEVREGVLALRSTVQPAQELMSAISSYSGKFERQSGIPVECSADRRAVQVRLAEKSALQVSRVLQEALSNIRKHADASLVTVRLASEGTTLTLEIEDDGRGFDFSEVQRADEEHFGLTTMNERIESIGGEFRVVTAPGRGTTVSVALPNGLPVKELV